MPRTIHLHPASLLAGVGFALLAFVAMGQSPVANRTTAASLPSSVHLVGPDSWVQVVEGTPYTVPAGQTFIPLAVGSDRRPSGEMRVDDEIVVSAVDQGAGHSHSMIPVPHGFFAGTGSTLTALATSIGNGQVWGFLIPAVAPRIVHQPAPSHTDWLVIEEGQPFTVPTGTLFVLTAVGSPGNQGDSFAGINGLSVFALTTNALDTFTNPVAIPRGLAALEGDVVTAGDDQPGLGARAWGYLVDA